ncbi:MAG: DUF3445 domain-containing protein, partial [Gloeomargarita sp. SKYB31]|nr:DUF3445 domain-containing protein [Gloeomargarita sp. SKYB31]
DRRVFQIDSDFPHYHQVKQAARQEHLAKYVQTWELSPAVERAVAEFMAQRLAQEYPQWFHLETWIDGWQLRCDLTGDTLAFDRKGRVRHPTYGSALDALAMQVQEDVCVVCRAGDRHWVSAIHLCFPNHWAAQDKIGKTFAEVHAPVPGMAPLNQRGAVLVHAMIAGPPMVRFAWGLSTDTELNHHPDQPAGRTFDPQHPQLYLRIERQVIWGLPTVDAALFTIRTYFRDVNVLRRDPRLCTLLQQAIRSMSPPSLTYKGLAAHWQEILAWLGAGSAQ